MALQEVHDTTETSLRALMADIVNDLHRLLKQQLLLFRAELREDLARARSTAAVLVCGLYCALGGLALLALMIVFLLSAAFSIPLWGSFGIVGGAAVIVGGLLLWTGKRRVTASNMLPIESAHELKENVQCLTHPN